MDAEERNLRMNVGLLYIGIILGVLGGIIGSFWSAYFIETIRRSNTDWVFLLITATIGLIFFVFYFTYAGIKLIRQSQTVKESKKENPKKGDNNILGLLSWVDNNKSKIFHPLDHFTLGKEY